jgi:nucleotide-binding universal stress UspA family protein
MPAVPADLLGERRKNVDRNRLLTFGDDASPYADVAWLFVTTQKWPEWAAELITVEPNETLEPAPEHEAKLHEWKPPHERSAANSGLAKLFFLHATGDPRLVLSRPSDLLVIGPRGPGLLKALHLGSTADWLLRRPESPLLIAKRGATVSSALVCTDGSPHAERAIRVLAELPWVREVDVTVLIVQTYEVDVQKATEAAMALLKPSAKSVMVHIESGNPTTAIMHQLNNNPVDLVVLGTRGLTGLRHLELGSTASAVAHAATCSVLVACEAR